MSLKGTPEVKGHPLCPFIETQVHCANDTLWCVRHVEKRQQLEVFSMSGPDAQQSFCKHLPHKNGSRTEQVATPSL